MKNGYNKYTTCLSCVPMEDIKEIQAIPVWIIENENGKQYYYDARNGKYIVEDLWFTE